MRTPAVALSVVAAIFAFAGPAGGQAARSNTAKFFAGLEIGGSSIDTDEFEGGSESGSGATIRIGYGFTTRFALYLEGSAATMGGDDGDWTLGHGELGMRWHFASPSRALIPFVDAGYTYRSIAPDDATLVDDEGNTVEGDFELSGGGLSLGGGLLYFFNPRWSLSTSVKWSTGAFDTVRYNNVTVSGFEFDATTTRFSIGVSWFPMMRR
jgi:hypothetical protein